MLSFVLRLEAYSVDIVLTIVGRGPSGFPQERGARAADQPMSSACNLSVLSDADAAQPSGALAGIPLHRQVRIGGSTS
jgi:hypothetical protein